MKLEDFLSLATEHSRRKIGELLKLGKIKVNQQISQDRKMKVDPNKDQITIDQKIIKNNSEYVYYILNKPNDVISTLNDPKNRKDLSIFINQIKQNIIPVGRLDRKTTGLMIFTNDGELTNHLLHPRYEIEKKYNVSLDKPLKKQDYHYLLNGFFLNDGPVRFLSLDMNSSESLTLTLKQGRNRIIRRAFQELGYEVIKLKRIQIGPIQLLDLPIGKMRKCTKKEIEELKNIYKD
mgnify:CR=1 FL=1